MVHGCLGHAVVHHAGKLNAVADAKFCSRRTCRSVGQITADINDVALGLLKMRGGLLGQHHGTKLKCSDELVGTTILAF